MAKVRKTGWVTLPKLTNDKALVASGSSLLGS
jgi:hypothetical protein